jgi:ligand-binding sensor domain-containing protein
MKEKRLTLSPCAPAIPCALVLWCATLAFAVAPEATGQYRFDRGFTSNRCTALLEDRRGDLWIGTEDNGLMRYRDGQFTTYTTAGGFAAPGRCLR